MSQQQYGLTPPISTASPTEKEVELNSQLISELKRQGSFESAQETALRGAVLNKLQDLATEFVFRVGISKNMPEQVARESGGKIFTYGSFRLGVFGPGKAALLCIDGLTLTVRASQAPILTRSWSRPDTSSVRTFLRCLSRCYGLERR